MWRRGRTGPRIVFDFKLMELLEERLPDIGDGHLTSNSDFHSNILK
jgi:hypothetical protein